MNIERTGTRQYHAVNSRGAAIEIGQGEGQWSPGELLQMALVGCNAMSADHRLAVVLGEDFQMEAEIQADYSEEENRFTGFAVTLRPQVGEPGATKSAAAVEKACERALGAIARQCTIERTLNHAVPQTRSIEPQ